jgi:uncharacterized membrane protein
MGDPTMVTPGNLAHLHLLLNHFPIVGMVIAVALYAIAHVGRSDTLVRNSLAVFFGLALITLPAFVTGDAAQTVLKGRTDISASALKAHQDVALYAFMVMEVTGAFAWLGLWQFRRISQVPALTRNLVWVCAIVSTLLMAQAGYVGGEIRHAEILTTPNETVTITGPVALLTPWFSTASTLKFVTFTWAWPLLESLHFVGLCLIFTALMTINLRMLGMMRQISYPALHRLLPIGMLGFGVNWVTGMLFFVQGPTPYMTSGIFYWKLAFMVLAGANFLYLTVVDETWALAPGDDARFADKLMATVSLACWVGVLYCGRMLPFLGNTF